MERFDEKEGLAMDEKHRAQSARHKANGITRRGKGAAVTFEESEV